MPLPGGQPRTLLSLFASRAGRSTLEARRPGTPALTGDAITLPEGERYQRSGPSSLPSQPPSPPPVRADVPRPSHRSPDRIRIPRALATRTV